MQKALARYGGHPAMTTPLLPPDPDEFGALADLAPALARMVAAVASDIALVIDEQGVIRNVAEGPAAMGADTTTWVGRRFEDVASNDTRTKVKLLLEEAQVKGLTRRREINHPSDAGAAVPVAWTAVRLGHTGPVVAVGRDLRAVSAIQQRLVAAQQDLERDYWRRRQTEQRHRRLFRVAHDAVLVLDAQALRLRDSNDVAAELFGSDATVVGLAPWPDVLPAAARAAVAELLHAARSSDRAAEIRVRAGRDEMPLDISATPLRIGEQLDLLVRARLAGLEDQHAEAGSLASRVDAAVEAVVITDSVGRIELANQTFARLVAHSDESALRGLSLSALVGDDDGRWMALLARAKQAGISQARQLELRHGAVRQSAQVQASLLTDGEQLAVGLSLRVDVEAAGSDRSKAQRLPAAQGASRVMQQAAAGLGHAPLGELLANALSELERDLIELALARAGGHRGAAALLLGLSAEDLGVRLRRLGIADPGLTH